MNTKGGDVASAAAIILPRDGSSFDLTGATAIDHIGTVGWRAGSIVVLQFDSNPQVNHNTGSSAG